MRDRLPRPLRQLWDVVEDTIQAGTRHELSLFAPAIAYSLVISLAPLTIALNLVAPTLLSGTEVLPGSPLAGSQISAERMFSGVVGIAGPAAPVVVVALVLWGASTLFSQAGAAITRIWQQGAAPGGIKSFVRQHLVAVGLLLVAGAALFLSSIVGNFLAGLATALQRLGAELDVSFSWVETLATSRLLVDFSFSVLIFLVAFTVVPRVRPRIRDVLPGTLITSAGYAVGQVVLSTYLSSSARFQVLGSFGALLAFLVWALYTSTIVLWGAELTHEIARRRACARGGEDAAPYSCGTPTDTVS